MTDVAKLLLTAPLTNRLCSDGGADSYDRPKEKPKDEISIQVSPGFCSSPCDYGSLTSPAYTSVPKGCVTRAIDGFTGLMDDDTKLSNTFQLGIFKMSGLFVLPF
jgi:hypothetical protein